MKVKAIIYARVSTKKQKIEGYSLPTQVTGCKEYATRHDFDVVGVIEDDVSGATSLGERNGGRRLLEWVANGDGVGAIIVWRLDRLSRPPDDELAQLMVIIQEFWKQGISIHDCDSGKIKKADMSSLFFAFFKGLAASKERSDITERSQRGRLAKAREGKWVGQGWTPYGYRKLGKKQESRLEINEDEAEVIRRIFNLFTGRNGPSMSLRSIAQILTQEGVPTPGRGGHGHGQHWNQSHISKRILKRRYYIGEFQYKGIQMNFPELAIIDNQTWEIAQGLLKNNKRRPRNNSSGVVYLVTGRVECTCGGTFSGFHTNRKGRIHAYYRCNRKTRYGRDACRERNLRVGDIDEKAWLWLVDTISDDDRLEEVISGMIEQVNAEMEPIREKLEAIEQLLIQAKQKIERLMVGFGDTEDAIIAKELKKGIENTASMIQSLERQKLGLEGRITNAEIIPVDRTRIKTLVRTLRRNLTEGGTAENRLTLIRDLNFRAQLFYRDGQKWLKLSLGLGEYLGEKNKVCLENHSYTRPVLCANTLILFSGEVMLE